MTHLTRFAGIFLCLIGGLVFAQVPQSFSYQAVCRNTNGAPLLNQPIHFNIELLQGSITGTVVYAETQRDTTSAFGVSMLEIGRGTPTTGTFVGINWANTPTFIRISFDATGGNNFIPLGTHELLSVPYALHSGNGLPNGTSPNQLLYWNGSAWVQLAPGNSGESLTLCGNTLTWATGGVCSGLVGTLSCSTAVNAGNLYQGVVASGVGSTISYSGGNGFSYNGQTVASTGVTGLTATLSAGTFASGNGTVVYTISGTPSASGNASFAINIGGQSCTLIRTVSITTWRPGMVHCSAPTAIVPVINPTTNKTWMDRNLGASQVATSSTDANAYGDLYQWGRFGDGHQCRNSGTTSTLSTTDTPGNGLFITSGADWRSTQNDNLWQGVNGINNPCPTGYRLPTEVELDSERLSWSGYNTIGAFASPLKLPLGGSRSYDSGALSDVGSDGYYCSAAFSGAYTRYLALRSSNAVVFSGYRGYGFSVRCIQD